MAAAGAACFVTFRPANEAWAFGNAPVIDWARAGALAGGAVSALIVLRRPWRSGTFLLIAPAQLVFLYGFFFTGVVDDMPKPDGREVVEARFFPTHSLPEPLAPSARRRLEIYTRRRR